MLGDEDDQHAHNHTLGLTCSGNFWRWTKGYMIQLLPASQNTSWTILPIVLQPHWSSFSSSNISNSLLSQGPLYFLSPLLRTFPKLFFWILILQTLAQRSPPHWGFLRDLDLNECLPQTPPPLPFPIIWSFLFPLYLYQMLSCLFVYLFSARYI